MDFRVDLDVFRGPLDLLLYLVRKHEVEITDIPIALITDQYLKHLEVLEQLDVNAVGDFLEMASTLCEIKSRMILPHSGETEESLDDPRQELVRQLLEYKKFKDAASMLEEHARQWQERFGRMAADIPAGRPDLAAQPLHDVELWDLVSAFGRIMRTAGGGPASSIVYDDTPIHVHMERIHAALRDSGRLAFSQLFLPIKHKSTLVGMFLAVLELVRHHTARADQDDVFSEIWLTPGDHWTDQLDLSTIDVSRPNDEVAAATKAPPAAAVTESSAMAAADSPAARPPGS